MTPRGGAASCSLPPASLLPSPTSSPHDQSATDFCKLQKARRCKPLALENASFIDFVPLYPLLYVLTPRQRSISKMKRHRSPDASGEGSSRTKLSKTSFESHAMDVEAEQSLESHQTLEISITLRSATKAARNDPKPPLSFEEWQRSFETGSDIAGPSGDPSSSQPIGDMENPRFSDLSRDGQHPAQDCTLVDPAPTAHSRQPSRDGNTDRSNQ